MSETLSSLPAEPLSAPPLCLLGLGLLSLPPSPALPDSEPANGSFLGDDSPPSATGFAPRGLLLATCGACVPKRRMAASSRAFCRYRELSSRLRVRTAASQLRSGLSSFSTGPTERWRICRAFFKLSLSRLGVNSSAASRLSPREASCAPGLRVRRGSSPTGAPGLRTLRISSRSRRRSVADDVLPAVAVGLDASPPALASLLLGCDADAVPGAEARSSARTRSSSRCLSCNHSRRRSCC
jgi:hypothetical protein